MEVSKLKCEVLMESQLNDSEEECKRICPEHCFFLFLRDYVILQNHDMLIFDRQTSYKCSVFIRGYGYAGIRARAQRYLYSTLLLSPYLFSHETKRHPYSIGITTTNIQGCKFQQKAVVRREFDAVVVIQSHVK